MRSFLRRATSLPLLVAAFGVALIAQGTQGSATQAKPPSPASPQISQPVVVPATAVLSGRITSAADGKPLARVRVVVTADEIFECPPVNPTGDTDHCPRYNRVELTDQDGRYSIDKLPKGKTFAVTAFKTGYATRAFGEQPSAPAPPLELANDEKRVGVDIALPSQHLVTGTLLDEDGRPMPGALVEAVPVDALNVVQSAASVSQSVSDDAGHFRLFGIPSGKYIVRAIDAAFGRAGDATGPLPYDPTYFPGVIAARDATQVTVEGGEQTLAPFKLKLTPPVRVPKPAAPVAAAVPPPAQKGKPQPAQAGKAAAGKPAAPVVKVPPTASISGQVTSIIQNKPLSRARVVVSADELAECPPDAPAGETDSCTRFTRVTLTDADGRYAIDKLPRGKTFIVTVSMAGYAARAFGETPPAVPPTFIELKDAEPKAGIDIQLLPHNFAAGVLLDTDETPFAGALVEALRAVYDDKGQRTFVTAAESVTDDQGEFRLQGLAPGQYFITAFDPAYARVGDELGQLFYGPTFYPGTVYQDDAVRITLDPGVPVTGLKFKLQIIRPARLKGKITAGGLQLLSGAVNLGPSRSSRSASFAVSEADIRPDGVFQFANILAERYVIRARAAVQVGGVSHFAMWTQPISGTDINDVNMQMSPGARLDGTIKWESKTSRPPLDQRNIRVRAPMADGSTLGDVASGEISADRTFSLMGAMDGLHYIRMENLPDPWRLQKVTIHGSDVTDIPYPFEYNKTYDGIEIVLSDVYTTLTGTAALEPGDLAQGYAVIAFPTNRLKWAPASRYIKLAYLDDKGRYAFRGLPPAEYYVAITRAADMSDLTSDVLLEKLSTDAPTIRLTDGDRRRLDVRAVIPRR